MNTTAMPAPHQEGKTFAAHGSVSAKISPGAAAERHVAPKPLREPPALFSEGGLTHGALSELLRALLHQF